MTDIEDEDLASALSAYLDRYSKYSRIERQRPQRGGSTIARRLSNRPLLSSAVAVLAALVIGVPVGVTLLLRSGGTTSPAGTAQGPAEIAGNGLVLGTLEAVGGPPPGTPRPLRGSITLRSSRGKAFTTTAGSDGAFAVRIPPGPYTVIGRSPLYDSGIADCQPIEPVTVVAGTTIRVVVACQEI
jgi:hypothetical protein